MASQREDLGLQAILEKMNSLITPLISGSFGDISTHFQKILVISQTSLQQTNQCKLNLEISYHFVKPPLIPLNWLRKPARVQSSIHMYVCMYVL